MAKNEIESIEWWSPALAKGKSERMAEDDPDRDVVER